MIFGLKNGFVKSLISFVGAILSLFLAVYLAGMASQFVYTQFIEPAFISQVETVIRQNGVNLDSVFVNVPKFISNSLASYGITPTSISHIIINSSVASVPKQISKLFSPVIINFLKLTFTVVLFVACMFLVRLISKLLGRVVKLPVLRQVDGLLGALFGVFKGYVIISIVICSLKIFLPTMKNLPEVFEMQSINSTALFKEMYNKNLTYGLFERF